MCSAIIKHSADTEPSKIDPRMSPVKFSFKINFETIFTLKHLPLQAFATSTLKYFRNAHFSQMLFEIYLTTNFRAIGPFPLCVKPFEKHSNDLFIQL